MISIRICAIIPTYNNPETLRDVVLRVKTHIPEIIIINDASSAVTHDLCNALAHEGIARVHHRVINGGKGAAVKDGLTIAAYEGFTHALQIDADGQHETHDIPHFLHAAQTGPYAMILGAPHFDSTAPKSRLWGRQISIFWTHLETGSTAITDPMCGFRIYPIHAALRVASNCGNRMDFDNAILVRMLWNRTPVINIPTRVRYLTASEGGVSHFRAVRDNIHISWMHTRLVITRIVHLVLGVFHRGT